MSDLLVPPPAPDDDGIPGEELPKIRITLVPQGNDVFFPSLDHNGLSLPVIQSTLVTCLAAVNQQLNGELQRLAEIAAEAENPLIMSPDEFKRRYRE
ncbi:MAG: hypothetical protein QGH25_08035 [Candidatus Latescibacteria bacterium]|jgi:hypothetical protein|nr:hypothetical protein [Candidatus Latescibacterota bacterium]